MWKEVYWKIFQQNMNCVYIMQVLGKKQEEVRFTA